MRNQPSQAELANEIAATRFALIDLGMYLDTHPECAEALRLFSDYNRTYRDLCATYAGLFGPLTMTDVGEGRGWSWGGDDFIGTGGC